MITVLSQMMSSGTDTGFDLREVNVHTKHKICSLCKKCNIDFNIGVANLYYLNISVANATRKLEFLETLGGGQPWMCLLLLQLNSALYQQLTSFFPFFLVT